MPPPVTDPIPRFIADASVEPTPYGRWAGRLAEEFRAACEKIAAEAKAPAPSELAWFPERGWGGRVYVPATGVSTNADGVTIEFFGYVSFVRPAEGDGEPGDFRSAADFTDVLAADNPGWDIDLNEEVIGAWKGEASRSGDVTLIWGNPLVQGAVAATAELGGGVVDQTPVTEERFTLVAVDAVKGFGDELYLEVRVWSKRNQQLAAESLYEEPEDEPEAEAPAG